MKKKRGWYGRVLFISAFIFLLHMTIITQNIQANEKYDLIAFMNECQKISNEPGIIGIIQWIPLEWWQVTLERAGISETNIREVLELFEPYTSFIVIHGRISSNGLPIFTSESAIRQHLRLEDKEGRFYKPIEDEEISAGVRNAIIMIKPIFSNMLGRMGDNMNFFFFTSKNKEGKKICEARQDGTFSVRLKGIQEIKDQLFQWVLPLNSLLPVKICPKCQREAKGSWKYCPWCGSLL